MKKSRGHKCRQILAIAVMTGLLLQAFAFSAHAAMTFSKSGQTGSVGFPLTFVICTPDGIQQMTVDGNTDPENPDHQKTTQADCATCLHFTCSGLGLTSLAESKPLKFDIRKQFSAENSAILTGHEAFLPRGRSPPSKI